MASYENGTRENLMQNSYIQAIHELATISVSTFVRTARAETQFGFPPSVF